MIDPVTENAKRKQKNMTGKTEAGGGPMWGMSLEFWEHGFFWSSGIAAVAGAITAASLLAAGIIGYKVADTVQRQSDEKIAAANARVAEAKLETEKLRASLAPRQLKRQVFLELLKGKPKAFVEIVYQREDNEAWDLALQIASALKEAGWANGEPSPITPEIIPGRFAQSPSTVGAGGQPRGVTVVARPASQADFDSVAGQNANSPFRALSNAILQGLGHVAGSMSGNEGPAVGKLRIVVGTKLAP